MVLEDLVDPRILRGSQDTLLLEHEPQAFPFLSFLLSMAVQAARACHKT